VLDQKKANLLPSHWAAQYQQSPLSAEDQMFPPDRWKNYDALVKESTRLKQIMSAAPVLTAAAEAGDPES
jgi:hypothetical protein